MIPFVHGLLPLLLCLGFADGWLGIYLDPDSDRPRVLEVIPDSPAEKAGLQGGDLILSIDGEKTTNLDAFVESVRRGEPGQKLRLRVERGDRELDVEVTLGDRPEGGGVPPLPEEPPDREPRRPPDERPGTPADEPAPAPAGTTGRAYLGVGIEASDRGVVVTRVVDDSPAAAAGLRPGDVLLRWGDRRLRSMDDLGAAIGAAKPGTAVTLRVQRGDQRREVRVELGSRPGEPRGGRAPEPAPQPSTQPGDAAAPKAVPAPVELPFGTDLDRGRRDAERSGRPLLLLFGASWDGTSQAQRRALADPSVRELLGRYVAVYVDADQHRDVLEQREVRELPVLMVERDGRLEWRHDGFLPVDSLRRQLGRGAAAGGLSPRRPQAGNRAQPEPPAPPPAPEAPAPEAPTPERSPGHDQTGDGVAEELRELRQEIEELRRLLEELRRSRGDGGRRRE